MLKKYFIYTFFLALLILSNISYATTIKGDVDNDKKITILDVRLLLQQYINGTHNEVDLAVIDMDGNTKIDIVDVRLLLQLYINGAQEVSPKVIIQSTDDHVIKAGDLVTYTIKLIGDNVVENPLDFIDIYTTNLDFKDKTLDNITPEIIYNEDDKEIIINIQTIDYITNVGHLDIIVKEGIVTNKDGSLKSEEVVRHDYVASINTTSNVDTIGTVVGVANSFYVKDYDFYLNDSKLESDRTTNEYLYTGLENQTDYEIKVVVEYYIDKSSNDTFSGEISKNVITGSNEGVEMHFLDVSEDPEKEDSSISAADMILIKTANGKYILIDAGYDAHDETKNTKIGGEVLKQYASKAWLTIPTIDYFVATHTDTDHTGGFNSLKTNGFSVNNVIVGCTYDEDKEKCGTTQSASVLNETNRTGDVIYVTAGNCLAIDNIVLNIFNPYPSKDVLNKFLTTPNANGIRKGAYVLEKVGYKTCTFIKESSAPKVDNYLNAHSVYNNHSIVTKMICGGQKILFMGDSEFPVEEILLGKVADAATKETLEATWRTPGDKNLDEVITTVSCNNSNGTDCFYGGYYNNDGTGMLVKFSNSWYHNDSVRVGTYLNLVKDIMNAENLTVSEVEAKYHLSRLTAKDISASILKKGHHGVLNSTSDDFLQAVAPEKIVVTGPGKYRRSKSLTGLLDRGPDFRIRMYFKNKLGSELTPKRADEEESSHINYENRWFNYVIGPSGVNQTGIGVTYKYGVVIKTTNGKTWNGFDTISNYMHDMYYYREIKNERECETKKT